MLKEDTNTNQGVSFAKLLTDFLDCHYLVRLPDRRVHVQVVFSLWFQFHVG